jgi:cytoskeletal protein CcmA (bactofilin family)
MFRVMRGGTVIGSGLKIKGDVSAEGLVEVNGQIEGDVRCTSLVVSPSAHIVGSVTAERVVVNGKVRRPRGTSSGSERPPTRHAYKDSTRAP